MTAEEFKEAYKNLVNNGFTCWRVSRGSSYSRLQLSRGRPPASALSYDRSIESFEDFDPDLLAMLYPEVLKITAAQVTKAITQNNNMVSEAGGHWYLISGDIGVE